MELVEQFNKAIDELESDPRLEVEVLRGDPYTEESLERLEAKIGSRLPDGYREFYLAVAPTRVKWRTWADPDVWGTLSFGSSYFDDRLHVAKDLEYLPKKGYFAVSEKMAKPDSESGRKSTRKLSESFAEAFEIMLRARGAHGWGPAYFGRWTGKHRDVRRANPRAGLFQAAIPELFDDFRLDDFGKAADISPVDDLGSLDQTSFDLAPEKAGLSFADRLRRQLVINQQYSRNRYFDIEIHPPVSQEEIDAAQEAIGFELSDTFLNYFRSCNGFRFSFVRLPHSKAEDDFTDEELRGLWTTFNEGGGQHGSVNVRPLGEIFTKRAMPPLDGRETTRFFAYVDDPLPGGHAGKTWHMVAVDLELGTVEPVLRLTTDYGADHQSAYPVEACTYFEWLLKSAGEFNAHKRLFKQCGFSVTEPIRRADPTELDQFLSSDDPFCAGNALRESNWVDGRIVQEDD